MILSAQLQYSKMLLVDLFEISIVNDQIANVILEFQSSKCKQENPKLDESMMSSPIKVVPVYNTVCTLLKQYTIVKICI